MGLVRYRLPVRHVIWDWNGTVFDDLPIVVAAVNASLASLGAPAIDADGYRSHYTRPVLRFYERLLGREVSPSEWDQIDVTFHDAYRRRLREAGLAADARDAFQAVLDADGTQSLLSMWWHDELVAASDRFDVRRYMTRIDGNRGEAGDTKGRHLLAHLQALRHGGVDIDRCLMVGDILDDAAAAEEAGVDCVLYDGGSHHRSQLESAGVPVADSLLDALVLGGLM